MIVHRLTAPADQKPVRDWLETEPGPTKLYQARSRRGHVIASEPGQDGSARARPQVFEQIAWPRISTTSFFATPGRGEKQRQSQNRDGGSGRAQNDDGAAADEATTDDPAALKAELARVKRELAAAQNFRRRAGQRRRNAKRPTEGFNEAQRMMAAGAKKPEQRPGLRSKALTLCWKQLNPRLARPAPNSPPPEGRHEGLAPPAPPSGRG